MPLAPFGHDLRGSAPNKADQPFRSGVPRLDYLLMAALLLIVAGWIVFRLVILLVE